MTFLPMHQNALKLKKYRTDYILVAAAAASSPWDADFPFPWHGGHIILYCSQAFVMK